MKEKTEIIKNTIIENQKVNQIIDSLNINNQLEKLAYKIENQNNLITEVNSFYDSAWTKLLFVISFIGIIVPLVIQYFQRKNINDVVDGLKEKFDSKIQNIQENNDLKIDLLVQKYENQITELENKNTKVLIEIDSSTFYLQGRALFMEKNFVGSAFSYLKSFEKLIECERFDRIIPIVNNMKRALEQTDNITIKKLDTLVENKYNGKNFEAMLTMLEEKINADSVILAKTSELKAIYKNKNRV